MKGSTSALVATYALFGLALLLAPSAARADIVWGSQCQLHAEPPECRDGLNNDHIEGTDLEDSDCLGPDDYDESEEGDQGRITCRDIIVRVDQPQGFPLPEPEICRECYWTELIDFRPLLDAPLSQIVKSLSEDLAPSTPFTLANPMPGILDDPAIPNLRLRYAGKRPVRGPAVIGTMTLREPFSIPEGLTYVGQAVDIRTGQVVTNTGILSLQAAQDGLFDMKLSYSRWRAGGAIGSLDGVDGELCPRWPWPWPWPRRPRIDVRISTYKIDKKTGLSQVTPVELGLLFPLSSGARVAPYAGAGLGYYDIDGTSADARDEIGGYAALGMDFHLADRWGLHVEGAYRSVGGRLDLDGPVVRAGVGFTF